MKKATIILMTMLFVSSCKGPGSGPLQTEAYKEEAPEKEMIGQQHTAPVSSEKINEIIEPGEGCITIANLIENKKKLSGKTVKIKGKVTKYNPAIMGKNWIHLQDGTDYNGEFDLTVTSDFQALLGTIVTVEGKIALDKDFGYGYEYSILMEDATISK